MVFFTASCQCGISAKDASTTQSNAISGKARRASVKAGKVWMMSPIEDILTSKTFTIIESLVEACAPI